MSKKFIIDENTSQQIWTLKAFAVISIFIAHMPLASCNSASFSLLYEMLGRIGVPVFLVLSGLLYKPLDIHGWKRRLKRLLVPLFLWGSVTYFIHCLPSDTAFSLVDYGLWLMGSNTFLYFVWMLLSITLLYQIFDAPYVWIFIGFGSILLSQLNLIPYTFHWTPYLNPLNYILYFSFGILIRRKNLWAYRESTRLGILALIIFVLVFMLSLDHSWKLFFNVHSLLMQIAATWLLIFLVSRLKISSKFLVYIGKVSFIIYLMHIQFASTITKLLVSFPSPYMQVLKIFVAFAVVLMLIYIMDILTNRLSILRKCRSLIGFVD